MAKPLKYPVSALVVLHDGQGHILLIERADRPGFWHESSVYEIYHHWRHRYPEGVFENREHVFSAEIPRNTPVRLAEGEHTAYCWFDVAEAAEKVFSPSNRAAILDLHKHM